jgi:tetratricopeptide (TPR) repeat protein
MERVLLVQGRIVTLLPVLDRLLKRDPRSALGHQMRVRALSLLDRPEQLADAGELWLSATPRLEVPYRELARVYQQRGDTERSIAVLERGREEVPRADALALELGEAYANTGRWRDAAHEWARAVGPDARGLHAVERRLNVLPDGGARVLPALVDALDALQAGPARLRAAAILAIDAGLRAQAESIAKRTVAALEAAAREPFLIEVARRADGAGLWEVAYWAYDVLDQAAEGSGTQVWAVRARLADLALVVGDTARAVKLYRQMEKAFDPGSPERRAALAARVILAARDGDAAAADRALRAFRSEFSGAPETDAAAAEVGAAHLLRGDADAAARAIDNVDGAHTTRLQGLLSLRQGQFDRARALLLSAAPQLHGERATQTIALASLLLRLSPAGGALLAEVAVGGPPGPDALQVVARRSEGLPDRERAALLDFAAEVAESSGRPTDADALRQVLVEQHPDSPEAPTAMLALARGLSARSTTTDEARILLARLIVDYPRSALVPQARRELERLASAGATR